MIEEFPYALMERTWKIMRKSISTFLKHFQYYTTTPVLIMIPFSASALVSQTLVGSSQISLGLFSFMSPTKPNLLLKDMTLLFPSIIIIIIVLFCLSSLLISKACVIESLKENHHKTLSTCLSIYKPLLITQLFNTFFSFSINTASLFLMSVLFSSIGTLGLLNTMLRSVCVVAFYAILTNSVVLCNLSLAVAGLENSMGYKAMHRAYLLRKGSDSLAMFLALPTNLGLASIEALFYLRVVRVYYYYYHDLVVERPTITMPMALEGIFIAYLYSIIVVLDTISCCLFLKRCRLDSSIGNPNDFCNRTEIV